MELGDNRASPTSRLRRINEKNYNSIAMKKGTKVSWQINGAGRRGLGTTLNDEDADGTVLVAVADFGLLLPSDGWNLVNVVSGPLGFHPVIHCTVTWLTVECA